MGPRTLLLLLSGALVLTETWAGECGLGRERPLREGRGACPGGVEGGRTPREGATPPPSPRRVLSRLVPSCPSPSSRPLFSLLRSPGPSPTFSVSRAPSPLPTPGLITSDPGPAPGGTSGRISPLRAPRLPLPELFLHLRVPARTRGAAFLCRRLRGRHAVRAVRQRRPESENAAAGAVDGAGGAGILGRDDTRCQESSTEIAIRLEHHARFLQPERGG